MKSFLGWLMLLIALAVPAVLFYNWWTQMQAPSALETAEDLPADSRFGKVSSRPAETTGAGAAVPESAAVAAASPAPASQAAEPKPKKRTARRRGKKLMVYAPKSDRDPTLSILDMKLIALREEARRKALAPMPVKKRVAAARPPPIWQRMELQGIISTPEGRGVIINDEIYYHGDKVLGATIRKITSSTVLFRYKGRTFYKKM